MEVCEHARGVVQLAPGDADHPPSGHLQASVAFAVGLECRTGSMSLPAIEFDDHPLRSPEAVGFDRLAVDVEQDIQLGSWQVGACEQRREPVLEPAATPARRSTPEAAQARPDRRHPSSARMKLQQPLQLLELKAMEIFGLTESRFKGFRGHLGSDVEKGASERGDGDTSPQRLLVRCESAEPSSDRCWRPGRSGSRDVDRREPTSLPTVLPPREPDDPPELSRRTVAEHGIGANPEHGGKPPALLRQISVTWRVDAAMHSVQAPATQSRVDRVFAQPESD